MALMVSRFNTPVGVMGVAHDGQHVRQAFFYDLDTPGRFRPGSVLSGNAGELARRIGAELDAYFKTPGHRFQLPLKPDGTAYQKRVWNSLLVIPSGRTATYGELSSRLQSSPRAIGQACKKNPLAVFIPCHRVTGKNHIGGYMGRQDALAYKQALLLHEGIIL